MYFWQKRSLVYFLILLMLFGTFSGVLFQNIRNTKAASCSITIETAEIVGKTIKFNWKSSGVPVGDEITLAVGSPSGASLPLPGFGDKISSNPYIYSGLPSQKAYFYFVAGPVGKTGVSCKSNIIYFTPPNTLTGAGSGGGPTTGEKCDPVKSPPTLAGKVTKSGSEVTVELGWEPISTSTITQNRSRVYDNGVQVSDQRNQKYYYWKDTFDAKEKHAYTATMMFPTDNTGNNWCETDPSEPVVYDPKTGEVSSTTSEDKSKEIFDKVTPPATGSDCQKRCDQGWTARHLPFLNPRGAIQLAVCEMQCTIINWMASIIAIVIDNVLFPALGLPSSSGGTGGGGGFSGEDTGGGGSGGGSGGAD